MTTPVALWIASPAPDGLSWLPWDLYQITPPDNAQALGDAAWWRRVAHRWAREDRKSWPGHLIAVRSADAGPPVFPASMADYYDAPLYTA